MVLTTTKFIFEVWAVWAGVTSLVGKKYFKEKTPNEQ